MISTNACGRLEELIPQPLYLGVYPIQVAAGALHDGRHAPVLCRKPGGGDHEG